MIQFQYCIGFLLPNELNNSCKKFVKEIEKNFSDFQNKLNQRQAHIKIKSPFTATRDELETLSLSLDRFAESQESLDLRFCNISLNKGDKLVLLLEPTKLEELKMNLCARLWEDFPERINPDSEQLFEPRVTLGIYKEVDNIKFLNHCSKLVRDFVTPEFSVQEIVLFERNNKNEAWRVKKAFPLQKKVPVMI